MLEIIIQGRGGQGAQTAGNLLARTFFNEGKHIQAFSTYGGARRGTPVSSFIRIDDKPIQRRCDIEHPNAILCFDASLLSTTLLEGTDKDTLIVVNSSRSADQFEHLTEGHIFTVDGFKISRENGLSRLINSALLGAFSYVLKSPSIDCMRETIAEAAPVKKEENVSACMAGYQLMQDRAST